jgi:hypothetical protein
MTKEFKVMTAVAVNSIYLLECDLVQPDRNLQEFRRKSLRSEERRVGKECDYRCSSRWGAGH